MANRNTEGRGSQRPEPLTPTHGQHAVLTVLPPSGPTTGVVLVLHGGQSVSHEPVRARHLSPVRMIPFAKELHRAGRAHGLSVWVLRNSVRGWNGAEMSPLWDANWALQQITEQHPGVPIYLLGHSMGGLTAVCAADHPQVQAIVALAPWLSPETPTTGVAGKRVLIVHGSTDHWTSPAQSLAFARRATPVAASLQYVSLRGVGHFMLRKVPVWQTLATGFVLTAHNNATGATATIPRRFPALLPPASVQVTL